MHFNFYIVLQVLRRCLETTEERATIRIRAVDENDLHVVEVFQQFHPDVRLM
jgi:hypothetical protein